MPELVNDFLSMMFLPQYLSFHSISGCPETGPISHGSPPPGTSLFQESFLSQGLLDIP
ncbi:hypothetical protein LptCag_1389 [Leptospirillum ferriphilum]|uniref:Uncharacterized protein n=1 Tax=Leptospirillum ferriphilum TaxID=178606 RepID=A0A094X535_9BACT|nr:hypothetical protein LptCag_1389 [Leptospirillum ferriphilum]